METKFARLWPALEALKAKGVTARVDGSDVHVHVALKHMAHFWTPCSCSKSAMTRAISDWPAPMDSSEPKFPDPHSRTNTRRSIPSRQDRQRRCRRSSCLRWTFLPVHVILPFEARCLVLVARRRADGKKTTSFQGIILIARNELRKCDRTRSERFIGVVVCLCVPTVSQLRTWADIDILIHRREPG